MRTDNLLSGNTKSCGCLKTKIEDLTGHRYGFWQVLSQAKREEHHIATTARTTKTNAR